LVAGGGG
jgi:hypothetical protein